MVKAVKWSEEALDDIDAVAEFIARDSEFHAMRVVEQVLALGDGLVEQPNSGRIVPELKSELIREKFIYSYRVIYQIELEEIHILAVLHGRRLLESIEDRF